MVKVNKTDKLTFDLHINQIDYNEQKKETLKRQISDKYGVPLKNITINVVPNVKDENGNDVSLASDIISNIQDPKFQQGLFKEYIDNSEWKDINFADIVAIDNEVNANVEFESYSKNKSYKFKYVKWNNYLSYGEGNYFDFTKLHGLVLLNGQPENQCGKTTFAIDLLRFALYGKAQKSPTLDSVFNIYKEEATEVMVEAGLEIGGCDYVIRRTVTRPSLNKRTKKSKCKQKLEYFKVVGDDFELISNCEGENVNDTNNIIRDSIGSVDDFNLIISATAYTLGDLIHLGQSDRSKLFSKWLGLLTIERKEEAAKNLWKVKHKPYLKSNTYNKASLLGDIEDYTLSIKGNESEILEYEKSIGESEKKIASLENDKENAYRAKKPISANVNPKTLDNTLNSYIEEMNSQKGLLKRYEDEYEKVKDVIFNEDDKNTIEISKKELLDLETQRNELLGDWRVLVSKKTEFETLVKKGLCPQCGQKTNNEEVNGRISETDNEIKKCVEEGTKKSEEIEEKKEFIRVLTEKSEKMKQKELLHLKIEAVNAKINSINSEIDKINKQKQEFAENEQNIKINNELDIKICNINETIKVEKEIINDNTRKKMQAENENKQWQSDIETRKKLIDELSEEEKLIRNWSVYQTMVGKNGIVKMVLRRALPILNNEVSRLLSGLCDFDVELSISEDNKILIEMVRGGQRLDLAVCASGFESVMSSMALRHALGLIATMSKANFTVFDEILDGVAVSNYDNVKELFNRMCSAYDFILHITHNELISDWHTQTITVNKGEDGISVISLK